MRLIARVQQSLMVENCSESETNMEGSEQYRTGQKHLIFTRSTEIALSWLFVSTFILSEAVTDIYPVFVKD